MDTKEQYMWGLVVDAVAFIENNNMAVTCEESRKINELLQNIIICDENQLQPQNSSAAMSRSVAATTTPKQRISDKHHMGQRKEENPMLGKRPRQGTGPLVVPRVLRPRRAVLSTTGTGSSAPAAPTQSSQQEINAGTTPSDRRGGRGIAVLDRQVAMPTAAGRKTKKSSQGTVRSGAAAETESDSEDNAVNTKTRARKDGIYTHTLLERRNVRPSVLPAPASCPTLPPPAAAQGKRVTFTEAELTKLQQVLPEFCDAGAGKTKKRRKLCEALRRDMKNHSVSGLLKKLTTMMIAERGVPPRKGTRVVPLVFTPAMHCRGLGNFPVIYQEDLEVSSFDDRNALYNSSSTAKESAKDDNLPTASAATASVLSVPTADRLSTGNIVMREEDFQDYETDHTWRDSSSSEKEGDLQSASEEEQGGSKAVCKRTYNKRAHTTPAIAAATSSPGTAPRALRTHRVPTQPFDSDRGVCASNYYKKYTEDDNRLVGKYSKRIAKGKCTQQLAVQELAKKLERTPHSVEQKLKDSSKKQQWW